MNNKQPTLKIGNLVTFKQNPQLIGIIINKWRNTFTESNYYIVNWLNHDIPNYRTSYAEYNLIKVSK